MLRIFLSMRTKKKMQIMQSLSLEEENIIKDIRNLFRLKKKLKQLKIEYLEILRIFLSMKNKKKIIINQYE